MFAGAVRETVFSRPDVIERVTKEFVPVALKAALINNPPRGAGSLGVEGAYLAEIGRTKAAPQGIVAANKYGRVLAWALNFDDASQIPKFLDYVLEQNKRHPGPEPFDTPRFMHFPSKPMASVPAIDNELPPVTQHTGGTDFCPATPPKARGTLEAKVWGRRKQGDGSFVEDATKQENYIEDVFYVDPGLQRQVLAAAAKGRGPEGFELPEAFARTVATYCYLGMLDVRPVNPPVPGHRASIKTLTLRARGGKIRLGAQHCEISGRTEVESSHPGRRDGAGYEHSVALEWSGTMILSRGRIVRLALWAKGHERLRWGNPRMMEAMGDDPASHLPAGRPLDIDAEVVYGILGESIPDAETWRGDGPAPELGGRRGPGRDFQPKLRRIHELLGKLMRDGKGAGATAALDDLLRKLEALDAAKPAGRGRSTLERIDAKSEQLQKLMKQRRAAGKSPLQMSELLSRFAGAMQRDELATAEKLLDQALKLASQE